MSKRFNTEAYVSEFLVSGEPFLTSSITTGSSALRIDFPTATSQVTIVNHGSDAIRVANSPAEALDSGTSGSYYQVPAGSTLAPMNIRTTALYLSCEGVSSNQFSLMAALTTIPSASIDEGP